MDWNVNFKYSSKIEKLKINSLSKGKTGLDRCKKCYTNQRKVYKYLDYSYRFDNFKKVRKIGWTEDFYFWLVTNI